MSNAGQSNGQQSTGAESDAVSSAVDQLTAAEAAARLGVKRDTLYAYVSRGLVDRTLSLDGRTSLFDARQIDDLRRSRRRTATGELQTIITTSITQVAETGHRHRGVPITDLVGQPFETVADHILGSTGSWELAPGHASAIADVIEALPPTLPVVDRFRVAVAVASGLDPFRHNPAPDAMARAGRMMVAAATMAIAGRPAHHRTSTAARCVDALMPSSPAPGPSAGSPTFSPDRADVVDAINTALVLLADHGLAASTFGARIAASVRADPYSIVAAGLGPVGGKLHGAASAAVHQMFADAERNGVDATIGRHLETGQRLPGVGHAIYTSVDPRETILTATIAAAWGGDQRLELLDQLRATLVDTMGGVPNIDFALGSLTWLLQAPDWAGEAIFANARIVGWTAHGIEEFAEPAMRFRPTARYTPAPPSDVHI